MSKLVAVEYEVFGKVQGVFFRKYTEKQAKSLGLRGWVMNTSEESVKGGLEGPEDKVSAMRLWLSKEGSPKSRIDKATFSNQRTIDKYSTQQFSNQRTIDKYSTQQFTIIK